MSAPLRLAALLCLAIATACTQFPELDMRGEAIDANAAYPALVPLEPLLAQTGDPRITDASRTDLAGRVAALRARASRLRGTVIDSGTRTRMETGVAL